MTFLPDGLVWLASFPKSGNTWLRILLANLSAAHDGPADINALHVRGGGIASGRPTFEADMLVDPSLLTDDEAERMRPAFHDFRARRKEPQFVKTHDAFTCLPDGMPVLGSAARGAFYVVRDPRDVAVSYSFFFDVDLEQATLELGTADLDLPASRLQFRQKLLGWSGHVRSWLDQRTVPVHVVRYEDLLADTAGELRRALDFVGAQASAEEIARTVDHSAFAELRRQETERGFRGGGSPRHKFFREGRAGAWRERLPSVLARKIERDHGEIMARLGYDRAAMGTAA
jgi:hypothetical protein